MECSVQTTGVPSPLFSRSAIAVEEGCRQCTRMPASSTVDGYSTGVAAAGSASPTLIVLEIACVVARSSDGLELEASDKDGHLRVSIMRCH